MDAQSDADRRRWRCVISFQLGDGSSKSGGTTAIALPAPTAQEKELRDLNIQLGKIQAAEYLDSRKKQQEFETSSTFAAQKRFHVPTVKVWLDGRGWSAEAFHGDQPAGGRVGGTYAMADRRQLGSQSPKEGEGHAFGGGPPDMTPDAPSVNIGARVARQRRSRREARPVDRELLKEIVERSASDQSQSQIARETDTPRVTVQRALAMLQPAINELRQFKRDEFMAGWQWLYLDTVRELIEKVAAGTLTPTGRKDLAITMGISSEKAMLLAGHPTAIVAGLHEVRISLPEIAERLASVGRTLGRQALGAAPVAPSSPGA